MGIHNLKKYTKIWFLMTLVSAQTAFASRFGAGVFTFAKILRFIMFLFFLVLLESNTKAIGGYSLWQVILFYLTFTLVETFSQFFLREVYRFRQYVVQGYFDYILIKPMSALFRALFGGSDILDGVLGIFLLVFLGFAIGQIGNVSVVGIIWYILLVINALMIALSFHIFVLGVGILTTEVDNAIMLYRDLMQMGRVPIDIYQDTIRSILTFVIPVGIMMAFPPQALIGVLSFQLLVVAFVIGGVSLFLSLAFWRYALAYYTSASS